MCHARTRVAQRDEARRDARHWPDGCANGACSIRVSLGLCAIHVLEIHLRRIRVDRRDFHPHPLA